MVEPSVLIRWVMYFFGSGYAAICGALAVTFAVIHAARVHRVRRRWNVVFLIVGLFLIICGAPAAPNWYVLATGVCSAYLIVWRRRFLASDGDNKSAPNSPEPAPPTPSIVERPRYSWLFTRKAVASSALLWLLTGLALELPYHVALPIKEPVSRLLVIGDSVSAGLVDGEVTWPKILAQNSTFDVLDESQPGATVKSALRQNERLGDATGLVVLEIGGNDAFEWAPVSQFAHDLEQLLTEVIRPGRTVIMFELPLLPFCGRYGQVQRRLAAKYRVQLIPKREFISLLTTRGSTVDGVHLSEVGQQRMAKLIVSYIRSSRRPSDH